MFISIKVDSWNQAKEIFANKPLWVFRGQEDDTWLPESTLYRQAVRGNYPLDRIHRCENGILMDFQRFAHHYLKDLPSENAYVDWLALLQHYGAPTRLVDFTHSFYVAAFFAVEQADKDSAVWAVNLTNLDYFAKKIMNYDKHGGFQDMNLKNIEKFNQYYSSSKHKSFILRVQPNRMHERLWLQQGLFLASTNPSQTFIENLAFSLKIENKMFYTTQPIISSDRIDLWATTKTSDDFYLDRISVVKLILPKKSHYDVRNDLRRMNINAATLFPGLDGFARSMSYHTSIFAE